MILECAKALLKEIPSLHLGQEQKAPSKEHLPTSQIWQAP